MLLFDHFQYKSVSLQFASPYTGMGNNPVNGVDPNGGYMFGMSGGQFWGMGIGMVGGSLAGYFIDKSNGGDGMQGAGLGAVGGGALGYGLGSVNWGAVGNGLGRFGRWMNTQFEGGWKNTSILLAVSAANGAGRGDDWDRNPIAENININDLVNSSEDELFGDFRFTIGFYTKGVLEIVGDHMIDHFRSNSGSDYSNDVLDNHITASSAFQNNFRTALNLVQERISSLNGNVEGYGTPVRFNPPSFTGLRGLHTLIGGTQFGSITLTKYKFNSKTNVFSGRISVNIMDDFGVSAGDVRAAANIPFSKGIRAMWILQHQRNFNPFRVVYNRQFDIKF